VGFTNHSDLVAGLSAESHCTKEIGENEIENIKIASRYIKSLKHSSKSNFVGKGDNVIGYM